jgi:hypothetical protein
MNNDTHDMRTSVMDAIQSGRVKMRPRWHFVFLSTLSALGILIGLLALVYATSLVLFLLRESGALFLPGFGGRGWWDLLRSLPFPTLLLILIFIIVLEVLARRYAFVYKKPLLTSALGIVVLIVLGGYLLAQTPLHAQLVHLARSGNLPSPAAELYLPPFMMRTDDVYRGVIVSTSPGELVIYDRGAGTTSVRLLPSTQLPQGADFTVGDSVVVIGDKTATGTVDAFGVREVEQQPGMEE